MTSLKRMRKSLKREFPPVGTKLVGSFFKKLYHAKIVEDKFMPSGRAVKLDGQNYRSMSAAAKAITKQSVNGWRFWKIQK